jgi:choice-of-anchor B domain-containing protein
MTDAENPVYIGRLPRTEGSPGSTWRDIKTYQNHAYIVSDAAGQHGMQVFDLTRLRDHGTEEIVFDMDAHYQGIASAHNIVINEETGFAYSVGSGGGGETCGGGLHMIDIRQPKTPTFAGCFSDPLTGRSNTGYSHDAQCFVYRGPDEDYSEHELCVGSNENSMSIADVTDKANPEALSRISYPRFGYVHQGWVSEDHRYFFMGDESDEISEARGDNPFSGTRTLVYDITDLEDPQLVKEFFGTTTASDHNLYVRGDLMFQSNYLAGLRVVDVSDPENPVEVGFFDTVPFSENTPSMSGSWSNFPFFPSGIVIVTSGQQGLFLVRPHRPVS